MTDPTNPFQRRQEVQEHLAMSAPSSADLSLRLAKFFQHIAKTAVFAGDTLDLFSVADLAVRLGLLVDVNFDPDIHENHFGAGVEPGDPWFLIAPDVLAALKDTPNER
jgi:hypothetical protein